MVLLNLRMVMVMDSLILFFLNSRIQLFGYMFSGFDFEKEKDFYLLFLILFESIFFIDWIQEKEEEGVGCTFGKKKTKNKKDEGSCTVGREGKLGFFVFCFLFFLKLSGPWAQFFSSFGLGRAR